MAKDSNKKAELVLQQLQAMAKEAFRRKGATPAMAEELGAFEVQLKWKLGGFEKEKFAKYLEAVIDEQVDEAMEHAMRFRPGKAWCFRCRSSECEHASPMHSREVLVGYAPTGTPRWLDFAQWALDRRHPEIDRLYGDQPGLLGIVQGAGETDKRLLPAFREGKYRPLAQATVGFWSFAEVPQDGKGLLALTFQVGMTPQAKHGVRLALNTIGIAPNDRPLERLWDQAEDLPWRKPVLWAQAALQSVRLKRRQQAQLEARVDGILGGLVRRLLQEERARFRRTHHASLRHQSRLRPTGQAIKDATETPLTRWLFDQKRGTWVVLGNRGRTHFFNEMGKLVSSVRYRKDAVEKKQKTGLWKPANEQDVKRLRSYLKNSPEDFMDS